MKDCDCPVCNPKPRKPILSDWDFVFQDWDLTTYRLRKDWPAYLLFAGLTALNLLAFFVLHPY